MVEVQGPAEIVIVTGLSGAGRRTAAHTMEDLGWYVVDNLPPAMLPILVDRMGMAERLAVVVDVRSREEFEQLPTAFAEVKARGYRVTVLFLEASDDVIVQRQESNRRPLPLQYDGRLLDGIVRERRLLADLRADASDSFESNPHVDPMYTLAILFTSGTTSAPKGVVITQANFVFSGVFVNWELGMNPEDRYMTSMVAARVNFQLSALAPVLTMGATLIMLSRYSATRFWREAREHRATLVQGMAMIVATLLRQPVDPEERNHQVREMHYFLPLSAKEKEAFEERFGVTLLNNYGSTECLIGAVTDPPHGERRWPSIGQAGPGYEVRVVDCQCTELPEGEVGELVLHGVPGVSLMAGYWNNPEATAEVLSEDGWYRTHDFAYVEDGWVYFMDRRVDLIKRSGESVSSAEVECTIESLDGVQEVAVIGVPDGVRGQAVKAFVVAEPGAGLDPQTIINHCEERLASFKVPSYVEFVEELPRGSYGKVNKQLLATS